MTLDFSKVNNWNSAQWMKFLYLSSQDESKLKKEHGAVVKSEGFKKFKAEFKDKEKAKKLVDLLIGNGLFQRQFQQIPSRYRAEFANPLSLDPNKPRNFFKNPPFPITRLILNQKRECILIAREENEEPLVLYQAAGKAWVTMEVTWVESGIDCLLGKEANLVDAKNGLNLGEINKLFHWIIINKHKAMEVVRILSNANKGPFHQSLCNLINEYVGWELSPHERQNAENLRNKRVDCFNNIYDKRDRYACQKIAGQMVQHGFFRNEEKAENLENQQDAKNR